MNTPKFVKDQDLFVEEMGSEVLLYEAGSHRAIYLNETASVVWKLCDGTRTAQDLIDLLSKGYPDARADLPRDVEQAVEMMLREGVLLAKR